MTALLHEVWSHGGPLNNYYDISVGDLGTTMVNDLSIR